MFMSGKKCELWVLERDEEEAQLFTSAVNAGLTTSHLFTGSIPMRDVDYKAKWDAEVKAGDILFGIWTPRQSDLTTVSTFIGTCGLHGHREIYRSWEFRILIFNPDAVGQGIGTEATRLILNYAFNRLNSWRVWLGCSEANIGAWKCYEKCGFKLEGVLRDEIYTHGKYHNARRYGILRPEWEAMSEVRHSEATKLLPSE